ncbi:thermonuclease family protein [Helicobacter jaachi]|uniref:Thermonuclease family protein n=1 Tax=Helicobacter jaachi TaxID=1677920 RepID=A0A4U8T7B2_9HELI|nr:thermonuclease family protein [Helicobacter jaachi]TLD95398.1 thermonuclease family protein [Helicobacter jaachi]
MRIFQHHYPTLLSITIVIILVLIHCTTYNFAYLSASQRLQGTIIKVADGDTLTLQNNENQKIKIRLYGIDAPESKQSYGKEAKDFLLTLCPLKSQAQVMLKDTDKYQRIVGIVFCNDIDVNAQLVKNGYAWAYDGYSLAYKHYEIQAKLESKGLWSEPNPIRPSDFRKDKKR